ncbi:hypothetical protein lpg0668 [Legionella pneumophila subsp. pneumophila str. Philadelphia 1]|uniref:Uncharacterized protein n=1 Tax=Legionella pneumophila subsp. pneumophila (strain Philadelphia 1 / ATCC 33152 / DSM 7513) TaxID=272624 RepID=Q5ZXR3_LEGPH|nr:hypothetical protein lpg0668 [Legionella pneumophila subsp. pneumophila str. Philadelphia 1]
MLDFQWLPYLLMQILQMIWKNAKAWPKLEKMIVVQLNMPVLANLKQMVQQLTGFICPKVLVKSWLTAQLKAN